MVKTSHTNEVVSYKRENGSSKLYEEIIVKGKVDTIPKALEYAVDKHQDKKCLGTRTILGSYFTSICMAEIPLIIIKHYHK